MTMTQKVHYLYLNFKASGEAHKVYKYQFNQPLEITSDCNASIQQIYYELKDKRRKVGAATLHLTGAGGSVINDINSAHKPNYACMIPSIGSVYKNIDLLPFKAGVYNSISVFICDLSGEILPFARLIMTIKIVVNE